MNGKRMFEFGEFKRACINAFLKRVPPKFEERAEKYLGTDEAKGFIKE